VYRKTGADQFPEEEIMALIPDNAPTREREQDIEKRFGIAQDGKPTEAQLRYQANLRADIADIANAINRDVADGREKSIALTHLEDALMWAGKAIFS
jgi:hypothetical protein